VIILRAKRLSCRSGALLGFMVLLGASITNCKLSERRTQNAWRDCLKSENAVTQIKGCDQLLPLVRSDEQIATLRLQRGVAYLKLKNYDKAIADFDEVIRLGPNDAVAYALRGSAYQSRGQLGVAVADLERAIQLNPELAREVNPQLAAIKFELGRESMKAHNLKGALAEYNDGIRADPTEWYGYYFRGYLYRKVGRFESARDDFNKARLLLANSDRNDEARKDIDEALADLPLAAQMEQRWIRYLRRIQSEGRYENWAGPPYDIFQRDRALE